MLFPISEPPPHDATGFDPNVAAGNRYLLVCQATSIQLDRGRWQFSLENVAGDLVLEAEDEELGDLNRLTLMAVLRGLESIDGPSAVTLLSTNRYVIRSLTDSLPRWRSSDFVWEHFGRAIDVQHADLWRRVDRALKIHRVEACLVSSKVVSGGAVSSTEDISASMRIDGAHAGINAPARRKRGHRPDTPSDPPANLSPDRLRSWLFATPEPHRQPSSSRFNRPNLAAGA